MRSFYCMFYLVSTILVLCCMNAVGEVHTETLQTAAGTAVILENEHLRMEFIPSSGGRCVSFQLKEHHQELVPKGYFGFFVDQWANFVWPSGLMHLPYSASIKQEKNRASVTLSLTIPEKGGGKGERSAQKSQEIPTDPGLVGLKLTKEITLESNNPVVQVRVILENPTNKDIAHALGFQHHFTLGKGGFLWNFPSVDGIVGPAKLPTQEHWCGKTETCEPTGGWISAVNTEDRSGLLFVLDYNTLDRIYSSSETAEWFMEPVSLPPGGKWETRYLICPVANAKNIIFASENHYADAVIHEESGKAELELTMTPIAQKQTGFTVGCVAYNGLDRSVITRETFEFFHADGKPQTLRFPVTLTKELSPQNNVIFKVYIRSADGLREEFEMNWTGQKNETINRFHYGQIGAGASALAGGGQDASYKMPKPLKKRNKVAVDTSALRQKIGKPDRVLVLFGLYTNFLRIHETLSDDYGDKLEWCNGRPGGIDGFPSTYERLLKNRLIVVSNISCQSLRDFRINMLADFVREGGTLLICGGFYTFGHGDFRGTAFDEFCPFEGMKPFEILKVEPGKPLKVTKTAIRDALSDGITVDANNEVAYLHVMKAKSDAKVLFHAGKYPVIAVRSYGKGKVIGCALTTMGEMPNPWYDGAWWKEFVKNAAK